MRALERMAAAFEQARLPLMAFKGAVLQMTLYDQPDQRPMRDLDVMIRPDRLDESLAVLESAGWQRRQVLLSDDFFPRYYYEVEYALGQVMPVIADVHIRPFRTMRYAQLVPDDALWAQARTQPIGSSQVLIPSPQDMLIHMAVHHAIHGANSEKWSTDIRRWIARYESTLDWGQLVQRVGAWRLNLPFLKGIEGAADGAERALLPHHVREAISTIPVNWRDRLALAHAPRDDDHPVGHAVVNILTTPRLKLVLGYLRRVALPGRAHMHQWYARDHRGWLAVAHLLRWTGPVHRRLSWLWRWRRSWSLRELDGDGLAIVADRDIRPGRPIARIRQTADATDRLRGPWRYLRRSVRGNVRLDSRRLIAIRKIRAGDVLVLAEDLQPAFTDGDPASCKSPPQPDPASHEPRHAA